MALPIYDWSAPESATSNQDFSGVADGIYVLTDCTGVTLTLEGSGTVSLGDLPAGACVAKRCEKVVFTGGTIKAFFLPT